MKVIPQTDKEWSEIMMHLYVSEKVQTHPEVQTVQQERKGSHLILRSGESFSDAGCDHMRTN